MTESAPTVIARTAEFEPGKAEAVVDVPFEITFPDLVGAHYVWQKTPGEFDTFHLGDAEARYRFYRQQFESRQGRIVDEYWSVNHASAAVVTLRAAAVPWRWLGKEPTAELYSATSWQTSELEPDVGKLVQEGEVLALRAREVLRSTPQRLVITRVFSVTAYLLGDFDGRTQTRRKSEHAIGAARAELAAIRAGYKTAAIRSAQVVYFWGMTIGLGAIVLLGLISVPFVRNAHHLLGPRRIEYVYGTAALAAVGAIVSVVQRMNANSFSVDYDVARGTLRQFGAFRPLVGAVFGVVIYFVLESGLLYGDQQPGRRAFAFYAVFAFLAGFSERFARDALDEVQGSVEAQGSSVSPAKTQAPVGPAPKPSTEVGDDPLAPVPDLEM